MGRKKGSRQDIVDFIVKNVSGHRSDIARLAAGHFKVSRQTILNALRSLIDDGVLTATGKKKGIAYELKTTKHVFSVELRPGLEESVVWESEVKNFLPPLPDNVREICQYAFTEMMNNAIEHSEGQSAIISVRINAAEIAFQIMDNGIGIFTKIQKYLNLPEKKDAVLELAKGKLTTDPASHTGEGIFFTSRLCDRFGILSEGVFFLGHDKRDLILEHDAEVKGTTISMSVMRDSKADAAEVFNRFALPEEDEYGFVRTSLLLKPLLAEGEMLVSRSQAKRILSRFWKFKEVVLDFDGIKQIGQAFADEVFRVFKRQHPEVKIIPLNTSEAVTRMIKHAEAGAQEDLAMELPFNRGDDYKG